MPKAPRKAVKSPGRSSVRSPGKNPGVVPGELPEGVETEGPALLLFEDQDPAVTRVRVYREAPNKRWMPHGYLATDEASQEKVAELFGGGRWIVQLVTATEGKSLIKATKMFEIPGAYRPPTGALPGMLPAAEVRTIETPLRPAQYIPSPADRVLSPNEMINQALMSQVLDVMKMTREGGAGSGIDWTPIITAGLGALTAFLGRETRPDPALQELRDMMLTARNQPGPVSSSLKDMIEAIKGLADVREAVGGNGATPVEKDPMDRMLEVGQMIVAAMAQRNGGAAPPSALPPGPRPQQTSTPVATEPAPSIPLWRQMLQDNRARLVDGARRDLDPAFMAEMAATYLPADLQGVAREFLSRPDHAAIAIQEIPELAEFPTFNATFWKEFRAAVLGEEEEPGSQAG